MQKMDESKLIPPRASVCEELKVKSSPSHSDVCLLSNTVQDCPVFEKALHDSDEHDTETVQALQSLTTSDDSATQRPTVDPQLSHVSGVDAKCMCAPKQDTLCVHTPTERRITTVTSTTVTSQTSAANEILRSVNIEPPVLAARRPTIGGKPIAVVRPLQNHTEHRQVALSTVSASPTDRQVTRPSAGELRDATLLIT